MTPSGSLLLASAQHISERPERRTKRAGLSPEPAKETHGDTSFWQEPERGRSKRKFQQAKEMLQRARTSEVFSIVSLRAQLKHVAPLEGLCSVANLTFPPWAGLVKGEVYSMHT